MSFCSERQVRIAIIGSAAVSLLGAGAAFIDYGTSHRVFAASQDKGRGTAVARRLPAAADPAARGLDTSAARVFGKGGKQDRADTLVSSGATALAAGAPPKHGEPQFITASLTPVEMAYAPKPSPRIYHDVNRGTKGDRLAAPQLSVAKLAPQDDASLADAHASAAVFLVAPPLADTQAAPAAAAQPENNVTASADAGGTSLSPADHQPQGKSSWDELVRLASMNGGDGEEKGATIFGGLSEKEFRARELRCMATAIYFEARDEPLRGQIAVAQVVMTRVRSEYYPKTICGVVYQGQWNRNACQFSFACDGKTDAPTEKKEWATALDVARQVISGKVFLKDVADSTHYHATYVHPHWVKLVKRVTQIGGHIFYKASFAPPLIANAEYNKL
jgi:spore germination cell wall hydrolase CwlJ-like protein